jgi:hypothetical protein
MIALFAVLECGSVKGEDLGNMSVLPNHHITVQLVNNGMKENLFTVDSSDISDESSLLLYIDDDPEILESEETGKELVQVEDQNSSLLHITARSLYLGIYAPVLRDGVYSIGSIIISAEKPLRGIQMASFYYPYDSEFGRSQLENMLVETPNLNLVVLRMGLHQDNLTSDRIEIGDWWVDARIGDEAYRDIWYAVDTIHEHNLRVMLWEDIGVGQNNEPGGWIARAEPANATEWWANYEDLILKIAKDAGKHNVEYLSVGNELRSLENQSERWERLIEEVRMVFPGDLIYVMNYWNRDWWPHVASISWFDSLDLLGISGYFPLTNTNQPQIQDLVEAWERNRESTPILDQVRQLSGSNEVEIFFMLQYRSVNGANKYPYKSGLIPESDNSIDLDEQSDLWEAFFRVWHDEECFAGVGAGMWLTDPIESQDPTGEHIQGKRAAKVIDQWFLDIGEG